MIYSTSRKGAGRKVILSAIASLREASCKGSVVPHQLRMPSLGQTSDELRVIAWLKAEGDSVTIGEPILEVETDKAVLQVESSFAGTLLKILRRADEVVLAGEPIALIGQPGESMDVDAPAQAEATPAVVPSAPAATRSSEQVLATPVARKLAKDQGIDISTVNGSGPGGRIERKDVEALMGKATPAPKAIEVIKAVEAVKPSKPMKR